MSCAASPLQTHARAHELRSDDALLPCSWTTNEIAESLQDLVICIEMLGCAVAHHYVFPIPSAIEYDQVRRGELESRYQNNEPLLNKVCWRGRDFLLSSIIADYTRFPVRV